MKKATLFLSILLIVFTLPSCAAREYPDCRVILCKMMELEAGLPAGRVYSTRADEGDEEYLRSSLVNSLFGNGERPMMADGWTDLALFLPSSSHPCEFAVILCNSAENATDTARMLCRRLDVIRKAKGEGEFSRLLDDATVTVIGNYALLVISSDTQSALNAAAKIIR